MVCPTGWIKALLTILWEDKWLIFSNLKKEFIRQLRKLLLRGN